MPIVLKPFYMIRHGQTVANRDGVFSGSIDVALTDMGKEQAAIARGHVESLPVKPTHIVHSHLSRARDTAGIINQNLKLPMSETPLLAEHHFGDWEQQPWEALHKDFWSGLNPPNGETHDEFAARLRQGFNHALSLEGTPLIVCHGGVFRGFNYIYGKVMTGVENCKLYSFTPLVDNDEFPWEIKLLS